MEKREQKLTVILWQAEQFVIIAMLKIMRKKKKGAYQDLAKSNRTKALDITQKVKKIVWERDNNCCIICGSPYAMPNAHYLSRGKHLGLGIEQNIVTLCTNCHRRYDQSTEREELKEIIKNYLKSKYEDWNEEDLIYKKYDWE